MKLFFFFSGITDGGRVSAKLLWGGGLDWAAVRVAENEGEKMVKTHNLNVRKTAYGVSAL